MPAPKSVWGIDIGKRALKALKLRSGDGELQVEAFDIIEHPKILSQDDPDRAPLIAAALEQFVARNSLLETPVVVAVPGQVSFTRFVKLPPVEKKKIPDIVRFEAEQQIPFNIDDVVWRWQTFEDPDSPDVEVGIFAMKRDDVDDTLSFFNEADVSVDAVQMAPLALYNFMTYDEQLAAEGATLLADIGTDKTDLVVADGPRIWTRTIQIGGNNFTQALVRAFKLSFTKAEKLKRTAATSKYARQIFQAMRPVFADLVQEIQRSVGYYTSLHRESRFRRVLGLGNGMRLPGLQKFLEQNLNIQVLRIDSYNRLRPSPAVNAPTFTENVPAFAVAYGLALQGLGLTPVTTNLLPGEIAHQRVWEKKRPWFGAAAAALVLAIILPLYRGYADKSVLSDADELQKAEQVVAQYRGLNRELNRLQGLDRPYLQELGQRGALLQYRTYWPTVVPTFTELVNRVFRDQPRIAEYGRYLSVDGALRRKLETPEVTAKLQTMSTSRVRGAPSPSARQELAALVQSAFTLLSEQEQARIADAMGGGNAGLAGRIALLLEFVQATPRADRQIAFVEDWTTDYYPNAQEAWKSVQKVRTGRTAPGGPGQPPPADLAGKRAFTLTLTVRTPLPRDNANRIFADLDNRSLAEAQGIAAFSIPEKGFAYAPIEAETSGGRRRTPAGPTREYEPWEMSEYRSGNQQQDQAVPTPYEELSRPDPQDGRFTLRWVVTIEPQP